MKLLLIDDFLDFTAEELLVDRGEVSADMPFREIRTWSSLNALVFISRISDEMNVLVSSSDLARCTTLKDIYELIKAAE